MVNSLLCSVPQTNLLLCPYIKSKLLPPCSPFYSRSSTVSDVAQCVVHWTTSPQRWLRDTPTVRKWTCGALVSSVMNVWLETHLLKHPAIQIHTKESPRCFWPHVLDKITQEISMSRNEILDIACIVLSLLKSIIMFSGGPAVPQSCVKWCKGPYLQATSPQPH